MKSRTFWALALVTLTAGTAVAADECPADHKDCVHLFKRFDIKGNYFATGQTLTEKQAQIAIKLLAENTIAVDPVDTIPVNAKLLNVYLYWSGSREVADENVEIKIGLLGGFQNVSADKCYLDGDNRTGSISKNFYNCRADITGIVEANGPLPYGDYTVKGVDAVILPGGNACETTKECYEAANKVSGNAYTSCSDKDNNEICKCNGASGCDFGQSTIGHASFSLVFIYEHGSQTRSIFLYDGMEAFIANTIEFPLQNLKTPATDNNQGTISYYIVEGDDDSAVAHPLAPDEFQGKLLDNPGEEVTFAWGTDAGFDPAFELATDDDGLNPIWQDPFGGTTGAGVDIETYPLAVPSKRTRAKLTVSSPWIQSVNFYKDEKCTGTTIGDINNCATGHQCQPCDAKNPGNNSCQAFGCYDKWANDGIGVNYILVGFDVFAPSFVNTSKGLSEGPVDGVPFNGDLNGDKQAQPGEKVQFKCQTTNQGNDKSTNLQFVDPLPPELVFAGINGKGDQVYAVYSGATGSADKTKYYPATVGTGNVVTAAITDLAVGETVTVYLEATISTTGWGAVGKTIFNQARFVADFVDPVHTDWEGKPGSEDATEITVVLGDKDDDGAPDQSDNCPDVANPGQEDMDGDGIGDACDPDIDGDGLPNGDELGEDNGGTDPKKKDTDGDGFDDGKDNCPLDKNPEKTSNGEQIDTDGDGIGDVCDQDADGDGLDKKAEDDHGTSDDDNDSDDDGLSDGCEVLGIVMIKNSDGTETNVCLAGQENHLTDPAKCDTDGDGLPDGLELGVITAKKLSGTGAGTKECHFIADQDNSTTTDPNDPDTDKGGVPDGDEDKGGDARNEHNGKVDDGELDPNLKSDDRVLAGGSTLISCAEGQGGSGGALAAGLLLLAVGLLLALRRRRAGVALLGLLVVLAAGTASAQTEVNYSPFHFAGNSKGIIFTEAGELEAPLDWFLGLGLNYADKPVVFRSGTDTSAIVGSDSEQPVQRRMGGDLMGGIGITRWFEMDLYVPLILNQEGKDPLSETGDTIKSFAIGDIVITPKLRIAGGKKGGGYLTLLLPVVIPSGKATAGSFAQEPTAAFRPTLAMSAGGRVVWAMNLGATIREPTDEGSVKQGMEFNFSTGFEFGLVSETTFLDIDIYGSTQFDSFFQTLEDTPLEGLIAVKQRFRRIYAMLGGGVGITQGRGIPEWRVFLNVHYASELLDRDGDGIGDDDDQCPDDPEDLDRWQDTDGCPDPDNDNDGILDAKDDCPNEPEDFDGFNDADGCPEQDNDQDGIVDAEDKCPLQPEDKDEFEDQDGCPDPDNDKDGILDTADKCPNQPEDKDGFEDIDGCPDPDNDQDKIPDVADKCPNEPENYNGYNDEDGCPDIMFTCKEFIIPEQVNFKTGSAKILPSSFKLLDTVASTIAAAPEAELTEVQGHTDNRGGKGYNIKLSQKRAESVMKYLLAKSVAPERLQPKGYGPDVPLEGPGKTGKEYWAKNRRVQFIVVKLDPTKSKKCQK